VGSVRYLVQHRLALARCQMPDKLDSVGFWNWDSPPQTVLAGFPGSERPRVGTAARNSPTAFLAGAIGILANGPGYALADEQSA
jgi:hypothetical protein